MSKPTDASRPKRMDVFAEHPPEVKIRTKKMMMYLVMFAIVMLFAGLTSVVLVSGESMYWVHVVPPKVLWASNTIVLLSSITMIMAVRKIKAGNKPAAIGFITSTFLLGIAFCITQSAGWKNLSSKGLGVTISMNEQGLKKARWNSLDQITGEYGKDYTIRYHGRTLVHDGNHYFDPGDELKATPLTSKFREKFNITGALICILIFLHIAHLILGLIYLCINMVRTWTGIIHKDNWISLHAGGMYWHFMGILWLYLFFFLFFLY
ncbi:MAG: hypothetical protein SH856_07165 [Flavobacteriales bacterium]|nr:hypothetical protein [Flavobacteriales bacterium]